MTSFRLILKNVYKNMHDYLIYFLTLTIAICMFYAFNSLGSQHAFESLNRTKGLLANQMEIYISILSVIIAIALAFLIIYANQFILKRRKKELGIYMLLGMSKSKISLIFLAETVVLGVCALVTGIVFGIIISQGLSIISLKLFSVDLNAFDVLFSMEALKKTIICFAIIFILVMLCNISVVSKVSLIELINANRRNENLKIKSGTVGFGILVAAIVCIFAAFRIFGHYGILPTNDSFKIGIGLLIIGGFLFFYSLAAVLTLISKKNKRFYLKNLNIFLVRQVGTRIQTNFISMTIISGLLAITICVISTGISIALTMNQHAQQSAPYDMTIVATVNKTKDLDIYSEVMSKGIQLDTYLEEHMQISMYSTDFYYRDMFDVNTTDLWEIDKNLPDTTVSIISVSDYNKTMNFQGKDEVELKDDSFLLNCNYEGTKKIMESFLENTKEIEIGGIKLKSQSDKLLSEVIMMTGVDNNDRGTIIVPDNIVSSLTKDYNIFSGMYKKTTNPDEVVDRLIPLTADLNSGYRYITKTMMYDMYYGMQALVAFICCYIGLIFLLICVALLALQQLTEMADSVQRYDILQKLGTDEDMINHTILKQVAIYFITPLMVACVISIFAMKEVTNLMIEFLNMHLSVNVIFTVLLFLLIYGGYFTATFITCKRMVRD